VASRRLNLTCENTPSTQFLLDRLYVGRTLIPNGYEPYFRKRARYRSVQSSTGIEGNAIGTVAGYAVLVDGADETNAEELELKSLDEAYELIQQISVDPSVRIDEGLIRTMNSIMQRGLPSVAAASGGRYRPGGTLIVNQRTGAIRYRPPAPELVPELMANFVVDVQGWIDNKTYEPPVIAALAHFGLISIHPFVDGNGRTARLLADMILQREGWSADGMISVSEAIAIQQQAYYDALYAAQGEDFAFDRDVTRFVDFHTEILNSAAISLEESAIGFRRRLQTFHEFNRGFSFNERQSLALMFMLDIAPLSTTTYAELTGCSPSAALADLTNLVREGVVERIGKGRNTRYRMSDAATQAVEGTGLEFEAEKSA